jgi:hypothetical protein
MRRGKTRTLGTLLAAGDVSGLVFDLPDETWIADIHRLRRAYDHTRLAFPVEITVAGSSGLGWFTPSQSSDFIVEQVREVARGCAPFQCKFTEVRTFPGSSVYYLSLHDEAPFHAFQRALAASQLRFEPARFSYTPHCTIAEVQADSPAFAHIEIAAFPVPSHAVTISSVSLYSVNFSNHACKFISRVSLGA